jgi:hypothetical protein
MAEVFLSPDIALPQYERLRQDPSRRKVLERVDEILEALEADPGQAWLRAHRFQNPPLWCVTFEASGEAWAILWSMDDGHEGRVLVDYIGSASFA